MIRIVIKMLLEKIEILLITTIKSDDISIIRSGSLVGFYFFNSLCSKKIPEFGAF